MSELHLRLRPLPALRALDMDTNKKELERKFTLLNGVVSQLNFRCRCVRQVGRHLCHDEAKKSTAVPFECGLSQKQSSGDEAQFYVEE